MNRRTIFAAVYIALTGAALLAMVGAAAMQSSEEEICLRFMGPDGQSVEFTATLSTCDLNDGQRVHVNTILEANEYCASMEQLFGSRDEVVLHVSALQQGVNFLTSDTYRQAALSYVDAGVLPAQSGILIRRSDVDEAVLTVNLEASFQVTGSYQDSSGEPISNICSAYNGQGESYSWPAGAFSIYLPNSAITQDVFVHRYAEDSHIIRIPAEDIASSLDQATGVADVGLISIPTAHADAARTVEIVLQNIQVPSPDRLGLEEVYLVNQDDGSIAVGVCYEVFDGRILADAQLTPGTYSVLCVPAGDPTDKSQFLIQRRDQFLAIDHLFNTLPWQDPTPPAGSIQLEELTVPSEPDEQDTVILLLDHTAAKSATAAMMAGLRQAPQ